jgi:hypothetical protein
MHGEPLINHLVPFSLRWHCKICDMDDDPLLANLPHWAGSFLTGLQLLSKFNSALLRNRKVYEYYPVHKSSPLVRNVVSIKSIHHFFSHGATTPYWATASRLHAHTQLDTTLLWTSDQPDAEISIWQHMTFTRNRYPCLRWDWNTQSQQARGWRPTP